MAKYFVLLLVGASLSYAHADLGSYQPQCKTQALTAVGKTARVSIDRVSFHTASIVGDGVDGLETVAAQVKGASGLWIVTLEYDDCSVFQPPKLLDN
jgi:hypothetical protein